MRTLLWEAIALVILSVAANVQARTLTVPSDYSTIQDGLSAAFSGDTVLVSPGMYTGPGNRDLSFLGKDIVLTSEQGADFTVIDCQGVARAIEFEDGETREAVFAGFMIWNGSAHHGGGIRCRDSSPTIRECVFIENEAVYTGGAIECVYYASPAIEDCEFFHNSVSGEWGDGGAIALSRSTADIARCSFRSNSCTDDGGAIEAAGSSPTIIDCEFVTNSAGGSTGGAAIHATETSSPEIRSCEFLQNHFFTLAVEDGSQAVVVQCTFDQSFGPSILVCDGAGVTAGNLIVAFGSPGRAVRCVGSGSIELECCDVYGNAGGDWVESIADQFGTNGNLCEDPMFCGLVNPDQPLSLDAMSPCAPAQAGPCGLIGRHGVGCASTVIERRSWGAIKAGFRSGCLPN